MLKLEFDVDCLILAITVLLGIFSLLLIFWDVHYFVRTAFVIIRGRFFEAKCKPEDTTSIYGLCTTNDLDIMFLHMNNARYIRELDFARFHFYDSTSIYKAIKKAKGNVVQSASCIRYRKPIPLFTTFKVTTKLIYWDDKSLYLEQQFISLKDGFIRAIAYSKQTAINANVPEILAKLIDKEESYRPNPPEELKHFTGLLDISSERLRKKDE